MAALARFTPLPPPESPPPAPETIDWHCCEVAYLQKGDQAAAQADAVHGADGAAQLAQRGTVRGTLAEAHLVRGLVGMKSPQAAQCKPWIDRALALRQAHDVPTSPWLGRTRALRGQCLLLSRATAPCAESEAAQARRILRSHASLSPGFTEPMDERQRALGRGA